MSDKWNERGRTAAGVVKRGAEATANGIHAATSFVVRNDGRVADGAQVATKVIGGGLGKVGDGLTAASQQASRSLHANATRLADAAQGAIIGTGPASAWRKAAGLLTWGLTKGATHTVGAAANVLTVLGKATAATGRVTERSAPAVGGAIGGAVRGAAEVTSNAVDAAALPASSSSQTPTISSSNSAAQIAGATIRPPRPSRSAGSRPLRVISRWL